MARGKKGRPVNGWLVVDKPAGVGSTTVVNKVKWAFQAQKAGHAGTLDPAATGVLAVALGVVPAIGWSVLSLWPGNRLAVKTNAAEA